MRAHTHLSLAPAVLLAGAVAAAANAQQPTTADLGPKIDAVFARFTDKTPGCAVSRQ